MELELGTQVALHGAHTAYVDHSPTTSWPGAACRRATHISLVLHRARVAGAVLLRRVFAPGLRRCRKSSSLRRSPKRLTRLTRRSQVISRAMAQCRSASPERASAPLHEIYGNEPLEPSAVDSTGAMDGPIDFPQTVEVFSHSLSDGKGEGAEPNCP